MKKIIIKFWSVDNANAGGYDIIVADNGICENIKYTLSGGEPKECAYRNAELLATILDCYFVVNNVEKRKPIEEKKEVI